MVGIPEMVMALHEVTEIAGRRRGDRRPSGVLLEVEEGKILALVAANGGEKSTLLSAIAGLVAPRRGSVRFEGHQLAGRAYLGI